MLSGGCDCGQIRYEVSADPIVQAACHCRSCQRASGGSPTLAVLVPSAAFKVTKGEPKVYWKAGDSGAKVGRAFCPSCGSPLYSLMSDDGPMTVLKAGSLDDPSFFKPAFDMYMVDAMPYHQGHPGAGRFEKNPG